MNKFYITTAIDYANGEPHIGHAYEKILADVVARVSRLQNKDVYFMTGLDEHGQKVEQTAQKSNIPPKELCDTIVHKFQSMCNKLNVKYDHYIRTTDEYHIKFVQQCLQKLFDSGEIYKAEYTGLYSISAERFVQVKDQVNGEWPLDFGQVIEIKESNYFFRLKKHQQWLIDYINDHPNFIYPKFRAKQVLEFLKEPINDLCISRPKDRLSWGIELPFDNQYVTYVWFDALLNYISGTLIKNREAYWPADLHIIGKDILVPAHTIYWPIMLHALNLPLPHTFLAHGWWLYSGEKMSKSRGNIINPMDYINDYGPDAFRYYLIREMNVGQDCDFNHERFITRYTTDLGNDLGNLLSRLVNMIKRYCNKIVPMIQNTDIQLQTMWEQIKDEVISNYNKFSFNIALEKIFSFINATNKYIEQHAPWKLAKSDKEEDKIKLQDVLGNALKSLQLSTFLLSPVIPHSADKILQTLGYSGNVNWNDLNFNNSLSNNKIGENIILFPRK